MVSYQSKMSCRLTILSGDDEVSSKHIQKIQNRKYVKKVEKQSGDRPTRFRHHYIDAKSRKQVGKGSKFEKEVSPLQNKRILLDWNSKKGAYTINRDNYDLPDDVLNQVSGMELYEYFLPPADVDYKKSTWNPTLKNPLSYFVSTDAEEEPMSSVPEVESAECKLREMKKDGDQNVAVIGITVKFASGGVENEENEQKLKGKLLYDVTRQKPVSFSLRTDPPGISFQKESGHNRFHVKHLNVSLSIRYDTEQPK